MTTPYALFMRLSFAVQVLIAAVLLMAFGSLLAVVTDWIQGLRKPRTDGHQPPLLHPVAAFGHDDEARILAVDSGADPINVEPTRISDILFADGFRITANDIFDRGLVPIINGDGRVVMVLDPEARTNIAVENWCGLKHGARIT